MCIYCYNRNSKESTEFTRKLHAEFAQHFQLDQANCTNSEFEWAASDCILPVKEYEVEMPYGKRQIGIQDYSFYEAAAVPDTIHPSLFMSGKCNYQSGVFEILPGKIYQVRGFDIANISFIRSKTGWIVQDTGTSAEAAKASIELLEQAIKEEVKNKIRAIIISHSHIDHYGGLKGIITEDQAGSPENGKIPIYVPAGFETEVMKENVFTGTAMLRRGCYQGGSSLPRSPKGTVNFGLGLQPSVKGYNSYISPTHFIEKDGPVLIDGITVNFQLTPGTEAPAEMNNYFADYRALWLAENCCGTLHNLYPIRGAQLRDSSGWADYTLEALKKFGDISDVVFQSHNWHHRNTEKQPDMVKQYLLNQAAIYKFLHDQTLFYANQGYTAKEIARMIKVPEELQKNWYTRPYYGSYQINARAVYTKYLGFYIGNPIDIDPLTEVEAAKTFVEYVGSEEKIIKKAELDFEDGNYRKAAFAASNVVLTNPQNEKARLLCADSFEQLGYQSEPSIWRNAYLQGAYELRYGVKNATLVYGKSSEKEGSLDITQMDTAKCMSVKQMLQFLGIAVDCSQLEQEDFKFNLTVFTTQGEEHFFLHLYHGVLLYLENYQENQDGVSYAHLSRENLFKLAQKKLETVRSEIETDNFEALLKLQEAVTDFSKTADFNIIEP